MNLAAALTMAFESAQAEAERMQREKDNAVAKAQQTAQRNAAAASAARNERDRLRDQLNTGTAYVASATHAAVVDYATTLTTVFEQCTAEYLDMAAKADGHAVDAAALYNGWKAIAK
jgi:lipid II:glycine glycyltransferase (peptidoglycan interpeptide bridge formation enzyme)